MKRKALLCTILLSGAFIFASTVTFSKDSISFETHDFEVNLNPFKVKVVTTSLVLGSLENKGIGAVLFSPYSYVFDNSAFKFSSASNNGIAVGFKLKNHNIVYVKSPRELVLYSFNSKYFSFMSSYFFKGVESKKLLLETTKRSDISFSRLFLGFESKYIKLFTVLDYSNNFGFYSLFGFKISFKGYSFSYYYGEPIKGLQENNLKQKYSITLDSSHLDYEFTYSFGHDPIYLEQYRFLSFEYALKVKFGSLLTIEKVGESKLKSDGKYTSKLSYKITSEHYNIKVGESFFIKAYNLTFGIKDGMNEIKGEWVLSKNRTIGFNAILFKGYELYFKIHL